MGRSEEDDRISVSSVVYNMAGSEEGRINYLKSLVIGAVQKGTGIAEALVSGYQTGPGMRYRNFANWAKNNSEFIDMFGTTGGTLAAVPSIDREAVGAVIETTLTGDEEVDNVESAEIHHGILHFWVLQYMYENHADPDIRIPRPAPFTGDNSYSYDSDLNEVTINLPTVPDETFTPTGYSTDPDERYLYVKYTPCIPAQGLAITYGSYVFLADGDPDPTFPAPWLKVLDDTAGVFEADLTATDECDSVYSDARTPVHHDFTPIVTSASEPTSYTHYIQDSYGGIDVDGAEFFNRTHKEFWVDWEVDTRVVTTDRTISIGGGVTRTDTITRTEEYLKKVRKTRESTQKVIAKTLLSPRWFIYQKGTGNSTLDTIMTLEEADDLDGIFYPPIPFRYNNKPVAPLNKSAKHWLISPGILPFSWVDDRYTAFLDSDKRDVQVAATLDGPWVSTKWLAAGPTANTYYVRARSRSDDAEISVDPADDLTDYDIESERPLYTIFYNRTDTNPGYVRIRTWNQVEANKWTVVSGPTLLQQAPTPSTYGVDVTMEDKYEVAKKAFKKAYNGKFDDVLNNIHDNDSLENIDYAYAVFGISLNVKEDACKKYIYNFLLHLMQVGGVTAPDDFMEQYAAAQESNQQWRDWWETTHNEDGTSSSIHETSDDGEHVPVEPVEPTRIPYPGVDWHTLDVSSVHEGLSDYRVKLRWAFIKESRGHGTLTKPDSSTAQPGELFFKVETSPFALMEEYNVGPTSIRTPPEYADLNENRVTLNWQVTDNTWRKLDIVGLTHTNDIYKDHAVIHTAAESVDWTLIEHSLDEEGNPVETDTGLYEESPFLFPMHETVFKEMSLVDATQMANACTFLVFNCYEEREEKWYETTLFKVILIVVIVIVAVAASIATGGGSLGAGGLAISGLVGSAVGSATLGFIAGALVDVAIGFALQYLITLVATALFGEKVGTIVGAVLGLVLGGFVGGGFDINAVTNMFSTAEGWLSLGIALTNAGGQFLEMQAKENMEETIRLLAKNSEQMARIQRLFETEFAKNEIDPKAVNRYIKEAVERPEVFLQRTLMTGSDVVKATLDAVNSYVDTRLSLALP